VKVPSTCRRTPTIGPWRVHIPQIKDIGQC